MTLDPIRNFWQALEVKGCAPKGEPWKGTAQCPAHEDRAPSLSFTEGVDGRVVLHCFAGCDPHDVIRALGLDWSALFPTGHRHSGPRRKVTRPDVDNGVPIVDLLSALNIAGIGWHRTTCSNLFIADQCPGCDERRPGGLWIWNEDWHESDDDAHCWSCQRPRGKVQLTCWNECDFTVILASLEHMLTAVERVPLRAVA